MTTFVPPEIDWLALAPLLVVLGAGVVGILVEAFVPARARRTTQIVLTLAALAGGFAVVAVLWPQIVAQPVQVLGGSVTLTPFALGTQGLVAALAFLGVLVVADRTSTGQDAFAPSASAVPGTSYEDLARRSGLEQTEIYPLLLFAAGGMMLFASTDDLIVMFIALEVLSLPLYVLCATARRRRLLSQEAAAKYFLLGAFASALFIFGVALIYGFAGTVRLLVIAQRVQQGGLPLEGMTVLLVAGVLLVTVGLLFKVGAVPFHAWTPDVYTGAPTPITGFMAACTKVAAVAALVVVLYRITIGVGAVSPETMQQLQAVIVVVAVLTMAVGTVVGSVQSDVKRLLAYSSIAHAGFLLVGVAGFRPEVQASTLFYLLAYGVATIGAFGVVTLVRERRVGATSGEDNGPVEDDGVVLGEATEIAQWAGLGRKAPWLTAAFALFLLSMAGIPLTAGFIAKFGAFSGATNGGLWWLAVLGVLASVVAVAFYLRLLVVMVFRRADDETVPERVPDAEDLGEGAGASGAPAGVGTATLVTPQVTASQQVAVTVVRSRGPAAVAIAVCAVVTVILGVFPSPVLGLVEQASKFVP
ncbi:NADH-quinone oxidoreductase subunit NuoN [Promicromonospora thailandica]|uniref:NADH-quinone oxidoreductase subunit N n=1 Tax=Promicromonospora thailandica TaxID=765201 RepID=A0A9X2G869_9MICO|nr:NADH-quinone oxidoreductase subunit NuoN [Promicromonospora thailandica]MCP2263721.1 NADH-quinone oxidoreductase subunit N [Promicromonospora thailandica]BFF19072.1 NADH-quinone oxidoreductase subunit NuoN [Promicromonospora thailandica]